MKHVDISMYRRFCPIFFLGAGLISLYYIDGLSQDYRYSDISYRPSLALCVKPCSHVYAHLHYTEKQQFFFFLLSPTQFSAKI